ncbi:MAG: nuclear transport factor 2 family protein [Blastocatellia bacterium]|nr:nuclear transport factor 2 family protein [Blastocatellia bacterium]
MSKNEDLIKKFYNCFQKLDYKGMGECYHKDVEFSDPAFVGLKGDRARAMWQMLCERATDFELTFNDVKADEQIGSAHWEAKYTFSKTGNRVHNIIEASFEFKDGVIIKHTDSFDLWRWAGMALGLKGKLLGWLPPVQAAIRKEAVDNLDKFLKKREK